METFNIGDMVYADDWCYGQIVEIVDTTAYIEFDTVTGGGCMQFELNDLRHADNNDNWCITTDELIGNEIYYLGWQEPVWIESGYFWTSKETFEKIITTDSRAKEKILFASRKTAIKHLKDLNIPQKCRVVKHGGFN